MIPNPAINRRATLICPSGSSFVLDFGALLQPDLPFKKRPDEVSTFDRPSGTKAKLSPLLLSFSSSQDSGESYLELLVLVFSVASVVASFGGFSSHKK